MKNTALLILIVLVTINQVFPQDKIEITTFPKMVPSDKKWILNINEEYLLELSELSLRDGNLCNVRLRSNPQSLGSIVEGTIGYPNKVYSITLKDFVKVPFAGENTYKITASSFTDTDENIINKIVFYPGQKVYLALCVNFIQIEEVELTNEEKRRYRLKEEEEQIKRKKELEYKKERDMKIDNLQSIIYDLKQISPTGYKSFISNQRVMIYRLFQNSTKDRYPLYFPSFEDLESQEKKYSSFKSEYSIRYKTPLYIDENESRFDYITEKKCIEGCNDYVNIINRIAVPPFVYKLDDVPVEVEIYLEKVDIDLTKGIANVKVKNGKVKFLNEIANEFARSQLETVLKLQSNGIHKIRYEFGEILGQKINNMIGDPK